MTEGERGARVPTSEIYVAIADERARQEQLCRSGKFTHTCASPDFVAFTHFGRTTVLGEEFGEVCRAALDVEKVAEHRGDDAAVLRAKLRKELIETAAAAVAYIEALDVLTKQECPDCAYVRATRQPGEVVLCPIHDATASEARRLAQG